MNINAFFNNALKVVKKHSPEILTALGVGGVITTSYLTSKATWAVARDEDADPHATDKEKIQKYWKLYVPAGISGAITIGCIIGAQRTNSRRTAIAVAAYSLSEKAFDEYKEKVVENIGAGKEQKIRDEITQEYVSNNPPKGDLVVIGGGHVLCCEMYTGRYFRCEVETINKAVNKINHMINSNLWTTLSEFYEILGLEYTSDCRDVGWKSERGLLELQWSTAMGPNNEPAVTFTYSYIDLL